MTQALRVTSLVTKGLVLAFFLSLGVSAPRWVSLSLLAAGAVVVVCGGIVSAVASERRGRPTSGDGAHTEVANPPSDQNTDREELR